MKKKKAASGSSLYQASQYAHLDGKPAAPHIRRARTGTADVGRGRALRHCRRARARFVQRGGYFFVCNAAGPPGPTACPKTMESIVQMWYFLCDLVCIATPYWMSGLGNGVSSFHLDSTGFQNGSLVKCSHSTSSCPYSPSYGTLGPVLLTVAWHTVLL